MIKTPRRKLFFFAGSTTVSLAVALACGPLSINGDLAVNPPNVEGGLTDTPGSETGPNGACLPGELDPTFGTRGTSFITYTGINDQLRRMTLDSQGRIIIAGITRSEDGGTYGFVGRVLPNGKRDDSFGTGGRVLLDFGYLTRATDVVVQPDGKILLGLVGSKLDTRDVDGGQQAEVEAPFMGAARLGANGERDPSFDAGLFAPTDNIDHNIEIVQAPDGKYIVAGTEAQRFMIVRLKSDGQVDTDFSPPDGIQRQNQRATLAEVFIDADGGSITTFGEAQPAEGVAPGIAFVRVRNGNGNDVDPSLNPDSGAPGQLIVNVGPSIDVQRVLIDSAHRMTIAATAYRAGTGGDLLLSRFDWAGNVDSTFGDGGFVFNTLSNDLDRYTALAFDSQGRIMALGRNEAPRGEGEAVFVARYDANGGLDPSFGDAGIATHRFGFDDDGVDMVLQPDGKILIAIEQSGTQNISRSNLLVRLCP